MTFLSLTLVDVLTLDPACAQAKHPVLVSAQSAQRAQHVSLLLLLLLLLTAKCLPIHKASCRSSQATHRVLVSAQRAQRAQHVNLLLHRVLTAVLHKLDATLFSRMIGGMCIPRSINHWSVLLVLLRIAPSLGVTALLH